MNKLCIFNKAKSCTNCGECDVCDLNPKKKCNNCGKCLEMEGYDIKAIQIEDIFENKNELKEYEETTELHTDSNNVLQDEEAWSYIDDIKELKDLMEEDEGLESYEEFPGFINLSKQRRGEQE